MLFDDDLYQLIVELFAKTKDGIITWTETVDEDAFRAVLNAGLVRVERHLDPFTDPDSVPSTTGLPYRVPKNFKSWEGYIYTLVILDEKSKELIRYIPEREERAVQLRNLWELACSVARRTKDKISAILKEVTAKQKHPTT